MKLLNYIFTLIALALLATSCSQDELPGGESTDEPGLTETFTFTVSPDLTMEGDTKTRATYDSDDQPTRCFMQIVGDDNVIPGVSDGNGSFTFSVALPPNITYTFLFWADNSTETVTDLSNVPYKIGTVAFSGKEEGTIEDIISKNNVMLKHVVAKVTLQTTADAELTMSKDVTLTTGCATAYNVSDEIIAGSNTQTYTETLTNNTIAANNEALSCYLIPTGSPQNVEIGVNLLSQTIQNISFAADTRYMLQGNLSMENEKWDVTEAYKKEAFTSCFFNEDGTLKGDDGSLGSKYLSGTEEDVKYIFEHYLQIEYPNLYELGQTYLYGMYINYNYVDNCMSITLDFTHEFFIYYNDDSYEQLVVPTIPGNN